MQTGPSMKKEIGCCAEVFVEFHLSSHALNAKCPSIHRLEDHRVWPVRLAKAEGRAEVVDEVGLLLDGGQQSLVDRLLVRYSVI